MRAAKSENDQIPGQMTICDLIEADRAWDEIASTGVVVPFFARDDAPATALARFAHNFQTAISKL